MRKEEKLSRVAWKKEDEEAAKRQRKAVSKSKWHKAPIGNVLLDYECNLDNYGDSSKLKAGRLRGAPMDIYLGLRVFLTKNMDK